jgi:hypothetical protein
LLQRHRQRQCFFQLRDGGRHIQLLARCARDWASVVMITPLAARSAIQSSVRPPRLHRAFSLGIDQVADADLSLPCSVEILMCSSPRRSSRRILFEAAVRITLRVSLRFVTKSDGCRHA